MPLDSSRFVATVDLARVRAALVDWSWLLREGAWDPILVSAAGDVFLVRESGEVFRLDTGGGELTRIAGSRAEFEAALQDPELIKDWLLTPVVEELLESGRGLVHGQCYGFSILPVFEEGSYGAANRFPLSAVEHVGVTGSLHGQLQGVPDGQKIRLSVVE
jgi:hypothetical protein